MEPSWKKLRDVGCYAHAFVNAGTCEAAPTPGTKEWGGRGRRARCSNRFRASVGVGLVFPLPVGNIEVNYVRAVRSGEHDRVKQGLQVGLATALAF